jgi:hypothetical protein
MRYQPTAILIVNSPTHDQELCKAVRMIWSSDNSRQGLFQSLLRDYSTQGIFNGESLDGWSVGSRLQVGATLRLLYYFPEESALMISQRLKSLETQRVDEDNFMQREVSNGVLTMAFINAVLWSEQPMIKGAVTEIESRTDDADIRKLIQESQKARKIPGR